MGFGMSLTIPEAVPCPSCANKVNDLPQSGSPRTNAVSFKTVNVYLVCCPVKGFFITLGYQYQAFFYFLERAVWQWQNCTASEKCLVLVPGLGRFWIILI